MVPLFLPFQELETVPPKQQIILTAATNKSRVRNRTTGELEAVPPQRSFFDPLGGTVPNS